LHRQEETIKNYEASTKVDRKEEKQMANNICKNSEMWTAGYNYRWKISYRSCIESVFVVVYHSYDIATVQLVATTFNKPYAS